MDASGCWIWRYGKTAHGYGVISVGGQMTVAHRSSYVAFVGEIPPGQIVRHTCDVRACVNPAHLCVGTHADNMRDKKVRHRAPSGEEHHFRKHPERAARGERSPHTSLVTNDVLEIRRRYAEEPQTTTATLAAVYGVTAASIKHIVHGESWGHVGGPAAPADLSSKRARGDRHGSRTHPEAVPRGERKPYSKLTDEQVLDIRNAYARGDVSKKALAREYGVDGHVLRNILAGTKWAHVGGPTFPPGAFPSCGVTNPQIAEAVALYLAGGVTYRDLGSMYGVAPGTVKKWMHDAGVPAQKHTRIAGNRKLTEAQVVEIREAHAAGRSQSQLARDHGMTQAAISSVVLGRSYPEAGGPIRKPSPVAHRLA